MIRLSKIKIITIKNYSRKHLRQQGNVSRKHSGNLKENKIKTDDRFYKSNKQTKNKIKNKSIDSKKQTKLQNSKG